MKFVWRTVAVCAAAAAFAACNRSAPLAPSASLGTGALHLARPLSAQTGNGAARSGHVSISVIGAETSRSLKGLRLHCRGRAGRTACEL